MGDRTLVTVQGFITPQQVLNPYDRKDDIPYDRKDDVVADGERVSVTISVWAGPGETNRIASTTAGPSAA